VMPALANSPCGPLAATAGLAYSGAEHWPRGRIMGQSGIRRTAFALLAGLIVYAAITGMGA